jgi:hypothetical protein
MRMVKAITLSCFAGLVTAAQTMDFEEYDPKSTLVVPAHSITRSNYPKRFIQFTNISFAHFGEKGWTAHALAELEADVRNGAVIVLPESCRMPTPQGLETSTSVIPSPLSQKTP